MRLATPLFLALTAAPALFGASLDATASVAYTLPNGSSGICRDTSLPLASCGPYGPNGRGFATASASFTSVSTAANGFQTSLGPGVIASGVPTARASASDSLTFFLDAPTAYARLSLAFALDATPSGAVSFSLVSSSPDCSYSVSAPSSGTVSLFCPVQSGVPLSLAFTSNSYVQVTSLQPNGSASARVSLTSGTLFADSTFAPLFGYNAVSESGSSYPFDGITFVPEPSTTALLTAGLAGLLWRGRRVAAKGVRQAHFS